MSKSFGAYFYHYSLSPTLWFDSFSSQRIVSVCIRLSGKIYKYINIYIYFSSSLRVGLRRFAISLVERALARRPTVGQVGRPRTLAPRLGFGQAGRLHVLAYRLVVDHARWRAGVGVLVLTASQRAYGRTARAVWSTAPCG